jgi:hypothetical protein
MTRYGSKASYAWERYQEEPESRRLGQLVRAVVADKGMDVTYWREHAPVVEEAANRLEAEDRAANERYDQMVEERMKSVLAALEERRHRWAEERKEEAYSKAMYLGEVPMNGITGRAYSRGENGYWFQPNTGAMGVRVRAEDLNFLESEASE